MPDPSVRRDVAIAVLAGAVTVGIGARFSLGERLLRALSRYEALQLDEWPLAMLVVVLALLWFALRRVRQSKDALAEARAAREGLDRALNDNRRLAAEYLRVQEAERRTLAAELHDELGQYLTAVKLAAIALRNVGAQAPESRAAAVESIVRNSEHVNAVVVGLIRQLRPVALDTLGLEAAIDHVVAEWRARLPQLSIDVDCQGELGGLGEALNLTVYRLVQEALTNVMKHAQARHVQVTIAHPAEGDELLVSVTDDGIGATGPMSNAGFGLIGMRERAAALGGTIDITTNAGRGFAVRVSLPVARTKG